VIGDRKIQRTALGMTAKGVARIFHWVVPCMEVEKVERVEIVAEPERTVEPLGTTVGRRVSMSVVRKLLKVGYRVVVVIGSILAVIGWLMAATVVVLAVQGVLQEIFCGCCAR